MTAQRNRKTARPRLAVKDIDSRSRFVALKAPAAPIKPDVEVNDRRAIMGDEGPVAATNPHNLAG